MSQKYLSFLEISKIKIEKTLRFYHNPIEMAKVNKIMTNAGENMGKGGHSFTIDGVIQSCNHT